MTLKDVGKMIELERFLMGIGKYKLAAQLGIHYHTYNSFIYQDKRTNSRTGKIIIDFLKSRGKDLSSLRLD